MTTPPLAMDLPRPAPAADAGPLDATPLRPGRGARPAPDRGQPDPRHQPRHPRARPPAGRREPGRGPGRDRRGARAPGRGRGPGPGRAVRWRPGSSGTSSCTTCASPSSRATSCAAGSAAPPPPATSATPCSCCSPAAPPRSPSAWSGSRTASRPRRPGSWASRTRANGPQVATWQETEARYAADLPSLFAEVRIGRRAGARSERALARLDRAIGAANVALEGARRVDRRRRSSDGHRRLAAGRRALRRARPAACLRRPRRRCHPGDRARAAPHQPRGPPGGRPRAGPGTPTSRPSSSGSRQTTRPRSRRPWTATGTPWPRSRAYLIEHDLATVPDDETIEVIETPEYLRSVMPFAAYFDPARFDADQRGLYVVTPAVDDDPNAMLEHYRASISNTSIHEAYPGHHLQLAVAARHPSLDPDAHRRPRVRRGLGHVLRADDARAGLRRRTRVPDRDVHRRGVAGLPDHPRRPDAPWPS